MTKRYEVCVALWHVPTIVGRTEVEFNEHNAIGSCTQEQRCELLREAVTSSASHFGQSVQPPRGVQRLNVFIVPEYFFADSAASHFVDEHTKSQIVESLKSISRIGNTLLIGGTVAWIKPIIREPGFINSMRSSRYKRAKKRIRKARALFDPNAKGESRSVTSLKKAKQEGKLDSYYFAENTSFIMYGGKQILKYHKRMNGSEVNEKDEENGRNLVWVPGPRNGEFKVKDLHFGIEICAEHNSGSLQQTTQVVDLQILISASMKVQPKARAHIKNGGYILHCDALELPSVHKLEKGSYRLIDAQLSQLKSPLNQDQIADRLITTQDYYRNKGEGQAKLEEKFIYVLTKLSGRLNYYTLPINV